MARRKQPAQKTGEQIGREMVEKLRSWEARARPAAVKGPLAQPGSLQDAEALTQEIAESLINILLLNAPSPAEIEALTQRFEEVTTLSRLLRAHIHDIQTRLDKLINHKENGT